MNTGYRGTFVISWSQSELDGSAAGSVDALRVGRVWRWSGTALRVDAPRDVLVLEGAKGMQELHRRAANNERGSAPGPIAEVHAAADDPFTAGFDVTDGNRQYRVALLPGGADSLPLLSFIGMPPPAATDLRIVEIRNASPRTYDRDAGTAGTICFTPGTRIATPDGPLAVEALQEGDRILTRDSGDQPVEWIGSRRVTGARLHVMPHLRPIRLRAHVMGQDEPDADLVVSPDHRILLRGDMAQALFNTAEVLVAAKDLVNDRTVIVDHGLREVTYIHLLLPAHQIIWANGIETESFHPAYAGLDDIAPDQRRRLQERLPGLDADPFAYGESARRALTGPEAALIRSEMA